jgi:hypothetical protein
MWATGEWRIIVKKNLSICERVRGEAKLLRGRMFVLIDKILREEPNIRDVHHED